MRDYYEFHLGVLFYFVLQITRKMSDLIGKVVKSPRVKRIVSSVGQSDNLKIFLQKLVDFGDESVVKLAETRVSWNH